jgi:hypothetical protein
MSGPRKLIFAVAGCSLVLIIGLAAWQIYKLQFWRGPDAQFGDQHLKTTIALVELHKVRYGRYPSQLSDLKFQGAWDPIATSAVSYRVNDAGTRYCVEVQRGWVGKPHIEMPAEFWQGTGYDSSLCK